MKKRILSLILAVVTVMGLWVTPAAAYYSPAEGVYVITTKLSSSKALDVYNNNTSNKTNIEIYSTNETSAQQFMLVSVGSGYYKIVHVKSGKVLDVYGGTAADGTNVQLYTYNGGDNQKWQFISAGDGYYYIKSKLGDYYLDVYRKQTANKTNVQICSKTGGNNQKWKLTQSYTKSSNTVTLLGTELSDYKVGSTYPTSYYATIDGSSVYLAAGQCYGFARYVQYKLYGYTEYSKSSKFVDITDGGVAAGSLTASMLKTWVTKAGVGAHIRTRSTSSKYAHSMVIVAITSTGFTIMDANGTGGTNKVGVKTYTWSGYVSSWGDRGISFIKAHV